MRSNITGEAIYPERTCVTSALQQWGYEAPHIIGQGAFAQVYRLKERATGRFLACKVSTECEMLRKESIIMQQLKHPLFPEYYHFVQGERCAFLFMEYVPGMNLHTLVAGRGHLSERRAVEIAMELAEGLCYLHESSSPMVFRDVKPENIVIQENGRVRLLDLGSVGEIKCAGNIITGTPGYAAPEQWEKREQVGIHSDVYSVGQVMLYMLTGRAPGNISGRGTDKYLYPRTLHKGIIRLVEDCTWGTSKERIPNMRSLIHRLAPYASGRRIDVLFAEIRTCLRRGKRAEYVFQQNILQ